MNSAEVDAIARDQWGKVYQGNGWDHEQLVDKFVERYKEHILHQDQFEIHDVDPDRLMKKCMSTNNSAAGMDQWGPAEFKLLSRESFVWLAKLLDAVEGGAKWPDQLKWAKAAFLAKDANDCNNPLASRVLMIMPTLYRKWAAMRLEDLEDIGWNATWQHGAMVAGVRERGADDGWWHSALLTEQDHVNGTPYTGGAADIYKCFDQINRPLLYSILERAGIPARVLVAYKAFQEDVEIRNSLAGGLGESYKRRCGIPQGCPFSMLYVAILMRPWILQMEALGLHQESWQTTYLFTQEDTIMAIDSR